MHVSAEHVRRDYVERSGNFLQILFRFLEDMLWYPFGRVQEGSDVLPAVPTWFVAEYAVCSQVG